MNCLDERRLLAVHFDDAPASDRAHVATCAACAARLRSLRVDLARVDTVLRATMPPRRAARRRAGHWVPVAVAAMLALAVLAYRHGGSPLTASDDDTLVLADEVASAMTSDVWPDDAPTDETAERSTCAWGDPLLGVGCDEPAVTQIAWQ
jgi:hypothetical protein